MEDKTTEQVNTNAPNPTGKGGFADNPQNINAGGRPKKRESISYWIQQFLDMTYEEMKQWEKTPDESKTVASILAHEAVINARDSLKERKEVTDRTDGRPTQKILTKELDELKDLPEDELFEILNKRYSS